MSGYRVSPKALDFALAHVERQGDTDILPPAFEFHAIRHSWSSVRDYLATQDLDTWQVRPLRKCMAPKGPLGFRIATQLDPLDMLLLTALVWEAGTRIERARVSPRVVFSHRFAPLSNGRLYSTEGSYEGFRRKSLELATQRPFFSTINPHSGWVVMTDIADFYPRLYTHRLENALREVASADHARVICKLINSWNDGVSYGIPVGPSGTRLLAEIAISDIDDALRGQRIRYCRYSDDFRIFAHSRSEASKHLAFLANVLYHSHGLTLQEAKTEIVSTETFIQRFQETDDQRTRSFLDESINETLGILGIDPYLRIEYDDLPFDLQEEVDRLNLEETVRDQLNRGASINVALAGFALRRLTQVGKISTTLADDIIAHIDKLTPIFRDVVAALSVVGKPGTAGHIKHMRRVRLLVNHRHLSHLDFYRMWLLTLFQNPNAARVDGWQRLYSRYTDPLTRREVVLAMGVANNQAWVRNEKHRLFDLGIWERRAFLRAANCLPADERRHWFNSIKDRLDNLDQWVITWAKSNPAM